MAKIETLTDNFDDNSTDASLWNIFTGYGTVTETGTQLQITPSTTNTGYNGYKSVNSYDLTNSQITVRVVQGVNAVSYIEQVLAASIGNNQLLFSLGTQLGMKIMTNGDPSDAVYTTRNDTNQAWWRIRHSVGLIFWETSPDGKTWTVQRTSAPPSFGISSMQIILQVGTWQVQSGGGTGIFDNLNVLGTSSGAWLGF